MKNVKIIFAIICLITSYSVDATIRAVSVSVNNSTAPENQSFILDVSNRRIDGFRLPIISGASHKVHFRGFLVDKCDRVEICKKNGGRIVRTIRGADLAQYNSNNEGNLEFTLNASDLPRVGKNFNIRIRYAVELNGFDRLDCKVTRRGTITAIEWGQGDPIRLGDNRDAHLRAGTTYRLIFTGTGFGSRQQLFSGLVNNLFNRPNLPFANSNLSCNAAGTRITLGFSPAANTSTEILTDLDILSSVTSLPFAFHIIGNRQSGWGPYVYHRYSSLSNNGDLTNLERIVIRPASSFTQLNLRIDDARNLFVSSAVEGTPFSQDDISDYTLCNSTNASSNIRIISIPDLSVIINNTELSTITQPFVVRLRQGGAVVFEWNVAGMTPLETKTLSFTRPENRVCGFGLGNNVSTNCVRCNDSQSGNIPRWSDSGILVEVDATNAVTEFNENDNANQF